MTEFDSAALTTQDKAFFIPIVSTEVKAGIQLLIAGILCSLKSPGIYSVWPPSAKRKGHEEICIKVSTILVNICISTAGFHH